MFGGFIASIEVKYMSAIIPKVRKKIQKCTGLGSYTAFEVVEVYVKEDCIKLKRCIINSTAVIKK